MKTETYNVGVTPSSLAIYEEYAYVCNSNNYGIAGSDSVTVLDLKKGVTKFTINDPSFNQPYRVAISGCKGYVTNSNSPSAVNQQGTVTIIDLKTNTVEGVINGFDGPSAIVATKSKLYVSNYGAPGGVQSGNGNTVSVVDIKTKTIIATITVDQAPAALALSPCEKFVYCVNYTTGLPGTGTINIISRKTNSIVGSVSGLSGPFGIDVTKDNIAYVTNFGSNNFAPYGTTVSVVDMKNKVIVKNIEIGIQPAGVCVSPCGEYVYVSTYNSLYSDPVHFTGLTYGEATINIIETKHNKLKRTFKVGQTASTVVAHKDKIYVTSYSLNIVQAITL